MTTILFAALSALCGLAMWSAVASIRGGWKSEYAFYLAGITAVAGTIVWSFHSLIVISLAMALYIFFLVKTVPPTRVFVYPVVWLIAFGLYETIQAVVKGTLFVPFLLALIVVSWMAIATLVSNAESERMAQAMELSKLEREELIAEQHRKLLPIAITLVLVALLATLFLQTL